MVIVPGLQNYCPLIRADSVSNSVGDKPGSNDNTDESECYLNYDE
jgi:hypothetical protein